MGELLSIGSSQNQSRVRYSEDVMIEILTSLDGKKEENGIRLDNDEQTACLAIAVICQVRWYCFKKSNNVKQK